MKEPRRVAPKAMEGAKARATEEADLFGEWIRTNIRNLKDVPTNNKSVRMKTLKELLRVQRVDVGQNAIGFERILRVKLADLGYETAGREGKGDFSIRFAEVIEEREPYFRGESCIVYADDDG